MMKIKTLIFAVLVGVSLTSTAQYSQLGMKNEFMLKVEGGYGFFMGNVGEVDKKTGRYNLDKFYSMANANVMAGVNISQDWFLGGGAGFCYFPSRNQKNFESLMGANVFIDMDFRPIWKAVMGLDYQPTSIKFAPMIGVRAGGSMLLAKNMLFTPLAEVYGGLNWYYWYHIHGMRNMTRNWHSFYATIGVAYMQQTVFLPVRLGWRW